MILRSRCFRLLPMIVVMGSIFFLSHQPGTSLPLALPPGADKLAHAVLYAFLAGAAIIAFSPSLRPGTWRSGALVVLFCVLYGVSDELHQAFIPGRDPSSGDLLADTAGAAVVAALWLRFTASQRVQAGR